MDEAGLERTAVAMGVSESSRLNRKFQQNETGQPRSRSETFAGRDWPDMLLAQPPSGKDATELRGAVFAIEVLLKVGYAVEFLLP